MTSAHDKAMRERDEALRDAETANDKRIEAELAARRELTRVDRALTQRDRAVKARDEALDAQRTAEQFAARETARPFF